LSLDFSKHVLWDYTYQQEPSGSYVFDLKTDDLQLRNKNEFIRALLSTLRQIYGNIITHNKIRLHEPDCNIVLLDQALNKYSRDIYGEMRLKARIDHAAQLTSTAKANLSKFTDYGFKIDSTSPYLHREISVLLYWLSVLKPFSIEPSPDVLKSMGLLGKFHNEFISYLLVQEALQLYNLKLTIHADLDRFSEFLYDLHYRHLSRSSLELFMGRYLKSI